MTFKIVAILAWVGLGIVLGFTLSSTRSGVVDSHPHEDFISWNPAANSLSIPTDVISISAENDKTSPASPTLQVSMNIKAIVDNIVAMDSQFNQFAAAYPVALQATAAQLERLIETLLSMESNAASIGIARIFYVRYVNLNPQAAITHFWNTVPPQSSQHRRVMFNIYHEWAWMDMAAVLENVVNVAPQKTREDIIAFLVADDHFTKEADLLALAEGFSERTRSAVLMAAAQRETFEQAFERFATMEGDHDIRRQGLYRIVRRWAAQDPNAALQSVQQMNASAQRNNLITAVIDIWADSDVEQALNVALNLPQGGDHALSVLGGLARKDGLRALELASLYRGKLDSSVKSHIMQSWAMADPRGVAFYLESKGGKGIQQDASQIVWHYTMRYPQEAYQWAQRMGLLNDRNVASNMGNALVQADLNKAETLFTTLPEGESRKGLFANIVRKRSKMDIAQTHSWLAQYQDEAGYKEARNNLLYEWTRRDPQQAAGVILSLDDNPNKTNHIHSIASNWYDKAPQSALSWVSNLSSSSLRDSTLANLAQKVGRFDVTEASYIADEIVDQRIRELVIEQIKEGP